MKDVIVIEKCSDGFTITRTLAEDVTKKELNERIKKVEGEIEAYTDAMENLIENKEEILRNNSEKIDNDIKAYDKAIENLKANLVALNDALKTGKGEASSEVKGDTSTGAVE